jgi:hypothetical protein
MTEKRDAVLVVTEEHQRRAAEFCRRHRDFTTTEAMDDLAEEFERVAREVRGEVVRWLREEGGGEGNYWANRYVVIFPGRLFVCQHKWEPMEETWNAEYEHCARCLVIRPL